MKTHVEVIVAGVPRPMKKIEADVIRLVLEAVRGDVRLAALCLRVSRNMVYRHALAAGVDIDKIRQEAGR